MADNAKNAKEVEEFQKRFARFSQEVEQNTGRPNLERVWDAVIVRSEVEKISEEMSDPSISEEKWKQLDREQDRAMKNEYYALGYFD